MVTIKHVLVVVVTITLGAAAWQLVPERRSADVAGPANEQSEGAHPHGSSVSQPAPPLPDENRETIEPDPIVPPDTSPAAPTEETEQPLRTPTPDSVFEAQYRWLSDASEAKSLASKCGRDLKDAKNEQYKLQHDLGQYEVYLFEFTPEGKRKPFVPKGRSSSFWQAIADEDREEWHIVRLPAAEYPELYRMLDERQWLLRRSRELAKTDKR